MKKHLLISLATLLMAVFASYAGVERSAATEYVDSPKGAVLRSPLARHLSKTRQLGAVRLHNTPAKAAPMRAAAKGRFAGMRTYPSPYTWSEFGNNGMPTSVWTTNAYTGSGFVADDKVYTFYTKVNQDYTLNSLGLNILSLDNGALLENVEYSVFDDKTKLVYAAAYNENEGVAYVVTSNGSSGYLLQKFNPETKAFTLVSRLPSSTAYPMAMAWHPRNNGIYMISETAYLERYNDSKGAFVRVGDTGLLIDETENGFPGAMVYSAKDENFVALIEQGEAYTGFYVVDAITGKATATTSLNNDSQWQILTCLDSNADALAPDAPTAVSAKFAGSSLSGTIELTFPTTNIGGSALSGELFAVISEGATVLSNTVSGAPGAKVSVPVTLTSGTHTLAVAAMQKGADKNLTGPSVKISLNVGGDVPSAPGNVVLSENSVTWSVPAAANGGYLDTSSLKYNVYINDELVAGSPFTGTSAAVTIPKTGNVAKVAAVEALAGDYVSPRAYSAVYVGRPPFSLPCLIAPLPGEGDLDAAVINLMSVLNVNGDNRTWIYDVQSEHTGGFYYLCSSDNAADDWLVLPQMNFPKAGYYRLSMEVWASNHYFASPERFEIGVGREAMASSLKIVSDVTTIDKKNNFEPYELSFYIEQPGNYYVGIHCISKANQFRLYARNFLVEAAQGTSAAPAAVTDMKATAAANGELKALVSFTLPDKDVDGAALDTSAELTATISCGEATTTVTGTPGQKINTSVDAKQGNNTVTVRIASADGSMSPAASVELYVGVDVPGYVDLTKIISADNLTLNLKWKLSTAGLTGGYVDPATCQYEIYRCAESGSYVKIAEAGIGATEWSFSVPAGTAQDIYQFGVRPVNVAGGADAFAICDVMLGKLNELPMKELFRSQGDAIIMNYDPIGVQNVAEQYCSWAFVDPAEYDSGEANATSTALMGYYQGYGQLTFPRFSTVGADNIKVSVSMLHGSMSSSEVVIAIVTPDSNFTPVATIDLTKDSGWKTTSVSVPASCLGQGWAGLTIRCFNSTQLHTFMMDAYTIEVNNNPGVALESVTSSGKVRVGGECKVDVVLANYSSANVDVPVLNAQFAAENGTVLKLEPAAGAPASIGRGEKVNVSYSFTAAPEHLGYGFVTVEIADPEKRDGVGAGEARVNVVKGYGNYISDLSAAQTDGKVNLTWSALDIKNKVTETFEDFNTWERGEQLGDFRNLDYDLQGTYGVSGYSYPGKYEPTAFEVFAGSEFPVAELQAYSGDQYIAAFSPNSSAKAPADDWLISPRVAGGSKLEMQILAPSNEFGEETVEVLYSKGGDDTSEFITLGTFTTKDMKWLKVEIDLPADARYFALHYTAFDTFCLLIDDIAFVPYEAGASVKEYKVFANGVEIGSTAATNFATDVADAEYYVVPVLRYADGTEVSGQRSNIVRTGSSGVDELGATGMIKAVKGGVEIAGFEGVARVYGVDGSLVATVDGRGSFVALAGGAYVLAVDGKVFKVAVR